MVKQDVGGVYDKDIYKHKQTKAAARVTRLLFFILGIVKQLQLYPVKNCNS
jgi:hypothetical protein